MCIINKLSISTCKDFWDSRTRWFSTIQLLWIIFGRKLLINFFGILFAAPLTTKFAVIINCHWDCISPFGLIVYVDCNLSFYLKYMYNFLAHNSQRLNDLYQSDSTLSVCLLALTTCIQIFDISPDKTWYAWPFGTITGAFIVVTLGRRV